MKVIVPQKTNDGDWPYEGNCPTCGKTLTFYKDITDNMVFHCYACKTAVKAVKPTPMTLAAIRYKNEENQ